MMGLRPPSRAISTSFASDEPVSQSVSIPTTQYSYAINHKSGCTRRTVHCQVGERRDGFDCDANLLGARECDEGLDPTRFRNALLVVHW